MSLKRIEIDYGWIFTPICLIFGHKLNQEKIQYCRKGYANIFDTNILYCKRCNKWMGTVEYRLTKEKSDLLDIVKKIKIA